MNEVIIMSGIPGSGKSTKAKEYKRGQSMIVSADDYFTKESGYAFDPTLIGEAHKDCFRRFMQAVTNEYDVVIVDNTNIEPWEISPYLAFANAMNYHVLIVEMHTPLGLCIQRNVHGVPYGVVRSMYARFLTRTLPGHWKTKGVFR